MWKKERKREKWHGKRSRDQELRIIGIEYQGGKRRNSIYIKCSSKMDLQGKRQYLMDLGEYFCGTRDYVGELCATLAQG